MLVIVGERGRAKARPYEDPQGPPLGGPRPRYTWGNPMHEHSNATRVRELFAAFRTADLDTIARSSRSTRCGTFPAAAGQLAGSAPRPRRDSSPSC